MHEASAQYQTLGRSMMCVAFSSHCEEVVSGLKPGRPDLYAGDLTVAPKLHL